MTRPPPSLWLRCGRCDRRPKLARVTPAPPGSWPGWHPESLANAAPLPGDDYILRERRRGVTYVIYPGPGGEGFVHVLTCLSCPAAEGPASRAYPYEVGGQLASFRPHAPDSCTGSARNGLPAGGGSSLRQACPRPSLFLPHDR